MGIIVEYNPDLALRDFSEYKKGNRKREECLPKEIKIGTIFPFLKEGQRNYWLFGEIPLLETKGNQNLSLPIGSIVILEATHILIKNKMYTQGKYKVIELFKDTKARFNGFAKIT